MLANTPPGMTSRILQSTASGIQRQLRFSNLASIDFYEGSLSAGSLVRLSFDPKRGNVVLVRFPFETEQPDASNPAIDTSVRASLVMDAAHIGSMLAAANVATSGTVVGCGCPDRRAAFGHSLQGRRHVVHVRSSLQELRIHGHVLSDDWCAVDIWCDDVTTIRNEISRLAHLEPTSVVDGGAGTPERVSRSLPQLVFRDPEQLISLREFFQAAADEVAWNG